MADAPAVQETLSALNGSANFVVIDAPPVLGIPDAINIARQVDGILLCVEAGKTPKNVLVRAQKSLELANNNLLGVVFNKVPQMPAYSQSKYYKYQ